MVKHRKSQDSVDWIIHLINSKKIFFTSSNYKEEQIFDLFKSKKISIKSSYPEKSTGIFEK